MERGKGPDIETAETAALEIATSERAVQLQAWQLRQMIPDEADPA